jgi:hypothetical protein
MIDRALKILVFATMAMEVAARAASPSLQEDLEGSSVQATIAVSEAGNASYHYYSRSAGTGTPASFASLTNDGSGDFFSTQIAPARPGDAAKRKTPSPESKELMQAPDLRAFDRTSDGFLRLPIQKLPAYSVLGSRVFVFRERDLYTKAGLVDLSFKRHPGLVVGNEFKLNEKRAYEMFMVDDWRATRSDYRDMACAMAVGDDRAEGRMILEAVDSEDLRLGSEGESGYDLPSSDSTLTGHAGSDSGRLELTEIPVDFTLVRLKW